LVPPGKKGFFAAGCLASKVVHLKLPCVAGPAPPAGSGAHEIECAWLEYAPAHGAVPWHQGNFSEELQLPARQCVAQLLSATSLQNRLITYMAYVRVLDARNPAQATRLEGINPAALCLIKANCV